VLILHDDPETVGPLRELLVAEFAVQVLPWLYAPAVAQSGEPPDAILARAVVDPRTMLDVVRTLRASSRTTHTPILVVAAPSAGLDSDAAFAAGADDVLQEPFMPAQLRARLRTCLLRRHSPAAN
jgi:DNA-binding response OmpR family regulator